MDFRVLPESTTTGSIVRESNSAVSDVHVPSPSNQREVSGSNVGALQRQNHVSFVMLHGVRIVSLHIDCKERLCLAQISNTLLKDFSYNEIHNRRVALGITCVQCTPVQLEILRRAGAMPVSSRRCGMITKREAERLVKSFLEDNTPPRLPENFYFEVHHECGWGCRGSFTPSRYNSSRAKCIKCSYCGMFFSPNKFIFHCHRTPNAKYVHPDAANFNSWRRHLKLINKSGLCELDYAWEDVKAMFNGGSRKRVLPSQSRNSEGQSERPQKQPHLSEHSSLDSASTKVNYPFPVLPTPSPYVPFPAQMINPRAPPHPAFPFAPPSANPYQTLSGLDNGSEQGQMQDFLKDKYTPLFYHYNSMWAKSLGLAPAMMEQYANIAKMNDRIETSFPSSNFQQMFQQLEEKRVERENNLGRIEIKKKGEVSKDRSEASLKVHTSRQRDPRHTSAFRPIAKEGNFFSGISKSNCNPKITDDKEELDDQHYYDNDKGDVEVDVCDDSGCDSNQADRLSLRSLVPAEAGLSSFCDDAPLKSRVSISHKDPPESPPTNSTDESKTSGTGKMDTVSKISLIIESKEEKMNESGKSGESDENANDSSEVPTEERKLDITSLDKMSKDELQREVLRLLHARAKSEEVIQKGVSSC